MKHRHNSWFITVHGIVSLIKETLQFVNLACVPFARHKSFPVEIKGTRHLHVPTDNTIMVMGWIVYGVCTIPPCQSF